MYHFYEIFSSLQAASAAELSFLMIVASAYGRRLTGLVLVASAFLGEIIFCCGSAGVC